jgi:hypothetical protein
MWKVRVLINFRWIPVIFLDRLRKTTKKSTRTVGPIWYTGAHWRFQLVARRWLWIILPTINMFHDHAYSMSCQRKNESSSHDSSISCIRRSFVSMFSLFLLGLLLMLKERAVVYSVGSSRQRSMLPYSVHSFSDPSADFRRLSLERLTLCCLVTECDIDVTVTIDGQQ